MNDNQFLTFKLGSELYGIEIDKVREILTYTGVTPLPNTQEWIMGVINLRGEVTPVVDLRIRFHTKGEIVYDDETIIIAVTTKDERMLGFVVDVVSDVETIDFDKMLPAPEIGSTINAHYLKGLIEKESSMVVIMDIDKILDKEEMSAVDSIRQ